MKNRNVFVYSKDEVKIRRLALLYKDYVYTDVKFDVVYIFIEGVGSIYEGPYYYIQMFMSIDERNQMAKTCGLINRGKRYKRDWFFEEEFI